MSNSNKIAEPKALILDIDGTLLSSVPRARAISEALKLHGIHLSPIKILQDTTGSFSFDSITKQFGAFSAKAFDKADTSPEALAEKERKAATFKTFEEHYLNILAKEPHPEKWLATGIKQLMRAYPNAKLIVTTNAENAAIAEASSGIVERALGRKFDKIFHSGMMPAKPAPDMALAALEFAKATPEEVWAIGDMTADLKAAHAAGVTQTLGLSGLAFDCVARKDELLAAGVTHVINNFEDETGPLPFGALTAVETKKILFAGGAYAQRAANKNSFKFD